MIIPGDKKITASADDFGISQKASRNILDLVKKGKIDRVEVMISDNITPDQAKTLLNSGVKLDVHFHLLGKKIDRWQTEPRVIETGVAKRMPVFLINYLFGCGIPKKTAREWEKQLIKFRQIFGRNPDGVSSHEHIHFFTPYFRIIIKLAQKYNIPYIRLGRQPNDLEKSHVSLVLDWLKKRNHPLFENSGLTTADYLISFDWINNWNNFIKKIPAGKIVEVVFHPELDSEYKILDS